MILVRNITHGLARPGSQPQDQVLSTLELKLNRDYFWLWPTYVLTVRTYTYVRGLKFLPNFLQDQACKTRRRYCKKSHVIISHGLAARPTSTKYPPKSKKYPLFWAGFKEVGLEVGLPPPMPHSPLFHPRPAPSASTLIVLPLPLSS